MLLELYDTLYELYLWSLDGRVPLSTFDEVAALFCRYRSYLNRRLSNG